MSNKFTSDEDKKLVELVKNHPLLYAVKTRRYRDSLIKINIWTHIAKEMRKDEADCKTRWKSIRDYYHRKRKDSRKPLGDSFDKKYGNLQFLDAEVSDVPPIKIEEDSDEDLPDLHAEYDIDSKYTCQTEEPMLIKNTSSDNEENSLGSTPKKKRYESEEDQHEERMELLVRGAPSVDPALEMFFKSMAITVCGFPAELRAEAKVKVLKIITELEVQANK